MPPLPRLRPKKAQRRYWEALEIDEMWTFMGRKQHKVWPWLAVQRASRPIVAWGLDLRGTDMLRRLCKALPRRYHRHTRYFTEA
jgi:insertion element IS1 protein InsB